MNTEEKARELMVKDRQHEKHNHEALLSLTEQELHDHPSVETEEKARELATEKRHHINNIEENMLSRSEEVINEH